MEPVKLGIVTVYLVRKGNDPILHIHLDHIRKNTTVPYKIYASANRLETNLLNHLKKLPEVIICECAPTEERGGKENCHYLEQLIRFAIKDGATHIATFHVDSFPIKKDWVQYLLQRMADDHLVAAVRRDEDQDLKPHSSFIFFLADFYRQYHPPLLLNEEEQATREYKEYARKVPHVKDTGFGIGYMLFRNGLSWYPLLRSNRREDHFLLGGIYEDTVFHFGAAAFTVVTPKTEKQRYFRRNAIIRSALARMAKLVPAVMQLEPWLAPPFENSGMARKIHRRNRKIQDGIKKRLYSNPDLYISFLKGEKSTGRLNRLV